MRIVYLAPFALWPKGTVISRVLPLALHVSRRGHEVIVFVPQERELQCELFTGTGKLVLRNLHVPEGNALRHAMTAVELTRKVKKACPDVVHLFKPKGYGGLAASLLRLSKQRGGNRPTFLVDGDDLEGYGGMNEVMPYPRSWKALFHLQERFLPPNADGATVASSFLREVYLELGVPGDVLRKVPNGPNPFFHDTASVETELLALLDGQLPFPVSRPADMDRTLPPGCRKALELLTPKRTIALFSRMRDHGTDRIVDIFRSVQEARPNTEFLIVGGGEEEGSKFRKECEAHLLPGSFVFTGGIPTSLMERVFSGSSIAILPLDDNLMTRAKCSAKLTDLMRLGKAVVADEVGECGSYIEDGISGLLVKEEDYSANVREFTARLVRLLDDPELAAGLGENARNRMVSEYSWDVLSERVMELYERLTAIS